MTESKKKNPWYAGGLHFECMQCGQCCSGPEEGYIWIKKQEVEFLANFLKITPGQTQQKYLQRVGLRRTIIEQPTTNDCIFLRETDGQRGCTIYPVRPNQCRTWPFWSDNLSSANAWNKAAQKCPGINRGRFYSFEEIEAIKAKKKWWPDEK